ncbi:MAG: SPOR domain-containing protein [Lewinellaceae bacterium]|nr:SPOR domain-containing protein [Saprospiraceae bacterium]MCB9340043.1 SPOR domain-containing protein [Lewinellaceae bacterium]
MKKSFLVLFAAIAFAFASSAQGTVTEKMEPGVANLMKRFVEINKTTTAVKGWRVQILATTDRQRMEDALRQFEELYPSIPADWVHAKPYYKVRAGAFTSKQDAMPTLYILKRDYPAAYPVQDNEIKPEELLK